MEENNKFIEDFHESTKYVRGQLPRGRMNWADEPETYKVYPSCIRIIELPGADKQGGIPFRNILSKRRTVRRYLAAPVSLVELSQLLWCHQGINFNYGERQLRTAPSAGALYPTETYLISNNVESLPQGLYHYLLREHSLELLKEGNLAEEIARAALDQKFIQDAAVVFVFTSVIKRCSWKYLKRACRYIYLDAGHIAENLHLSAVDMGFGACPIAAFYDEEVDKVLGVDGREETAIYMYAIGRKPG